MQYSYILLCAKRNVLGAGCDADKLEPIWVSTGKQAVLPIRCMDLPFVARVAFHNFRFSRLVLDFFGPLGLRPFHARCPTCDLILCGVRDGRVLRRPATKRDEPDRMERLLAVIRPLPASRSCLCSDGGRVGSGCERSNPLYAEKEASECLGSSVAVATFGVGDRVRAMMLVANVEISLDFRPWSKLVRSPHDMSSLSELLAGHGDPSAFISSPPEYIESAPKEVRDRIKALKQLQLASIDVQAEFSKKVHELECDFRAKFEALNNKVRVICSSGLLSPVFRGARLSPAPTSLERTRPPSRSSAT